MAKRDQDGQITAMASLTATACGKQSPPSVITHLNLASLNGWIAYTIYDDFLDNEGQPELLGVANLAARRSVANFHQALPAKAAFQSLVASVFDQVDTANQWETLRARAIWQGEDLSLPDLPDYGNYSQLADRSWGHWLAAAGVFYALGYAPDSPEVANLQTFFHHFLIARQLNDDAHDWEEDLRAGRLSAAVTLLLRSVMPEGSALTRDDIVYLRQQFWETTIVDIVAVIQKHLTAAQTALRSCPALVDHRTFDNWLTKLRHATERALSERQEAQKFIASYSHD